MYMKNYKLIYLVSILFAFTACEKNDFIADVVTTGQQTPSAYWELPSSTVGAGNNVEFVGQFFSAEKNPIDRMEIWYSETEHKSMSVTCPNLTTNYVKSLATDEVVHINQRKATFEFSEDLWDNSKRNYVLTSSFPTSNSLKPVTWTNVANFDQDKFTTLFPENFMSEFRSELYTEIEQKDKYADLRKLLLSLNVMDDIELKSYTDSIFNDNTQLWVFWIKDEAKSTIKSKYDAIEFKDLIYDSANAAYRVAYEKNYTLNATFKVIDKKGNTGVTESKEITLN